MGDTESSQHKSSPNPDLSSWIGEVMKETSITTTQGETSAKPGIQKIGLMPQDTKDYQKYYMPQAVSLGPYHHGSRNSMFIQNLKPYITKMQCDSNEEKLKSCSYKLLGKIEEVRNYYEKDRTKGFSDCQFTTMMLEDGFFILYFIDKNKDDNYEGHELGLKSYHIASIQQDLFLLENQVPYMVLHELMSLRGNELYWLHAIMKFIKNHYFLASKRVVKKNSLKKFLFISEYECAHLLQLLNVRVVGKSKVSRYKITPRCTLHNVSELQAVGITFTPSKTSCMTDVQFKSCGFSAYLELPAIAVGGSTWCMLLNLVAYEMCSNDPNESSVTSYICFLGSLISSTEDVKELRKAGILDNSLGSDEEVANLFKEISYKLVPNPYIYAVEKLKIKKHYDKSRRAKTWATQFKQEYFKSPWSPLALVGAIVALFLGGVQAYFSVWPAPGECDALCKYLKQNHHL